MRQRAEAIARERAAQSPERLEALSSEATQLMLHELRVHQIQLELQNEELRRTHMELDASRACYFDLYDLAPVGYCTLSEEGLILQANLSAATLVGQARGALVKRPLSAFILDSDQDIFYLHREQLIKTGEPQSFELRMMRKDGTQFWAHLEATAAQDADGGPVLRIVLTNVTERKQADEERERLLLILSQSDRLASIGTLAAGVAHEINNPLAYVLASTSFAMEELRGHGTLLDPSRLAEVISALGDALDGAQRMGRIVRDLKIFSGPEDNRTSQVDIEQVLESSIGMVNNEIRYRAQLVRDFGSVPPVEASVLRLGQVFLNLLMNAAQAIAESQASSNEIRVSTRLDPSGQVRVEVRDTGPGIPADIVNRIFDPFFTTKPVGVGTGLGLAICRALVIGLGGEISVESTVGRGTTFTVLLPVAEARPETGRKMERGMQPHV